MVRSTLIGRRRRLGIEHLETRQCLDSMPLLWMQDNRFERGNLLPDDFVERFQDPETWQVALRTIDTFYLNEESIRNTANGISSAFIRDTMTPVLNASQANIAIDTPAANFLSRRTRGSGPAIDQVLQDHLNWIDSLVSAGLRVRTISLNGVLSDTVPGDTNWFSYSLNERVADVTAYAQRVVQRFPWMRVGIIDSSPTQGLAYQAIYSSVQTSMNQVGLTVDHIHLDMPVNLIGSGQRHTWASVIDIQRYVQNDVRSRFGMMLTSQEGGGFSNHRWAQRIMAGLSEYQTAIRQIGRADDQPDRIIVTSRYRYPDTSVPELVPEPVVDGLGDLRLRNTSQSIIQLSNLLRAYDDFSDGRLQTELIQVFPVAASASSTAPSTPTDRRAATDAVFARGIVDASESTRQFQWQSTTGDSTPWLKAVLPKRLGVDWVRLWPFRGSNNSDGGALADVYVSRLTEADANSTSNPLANPSQWSLVKTVDLRGTSDAYVDARFSLVQTPAIAIVFRSAQGQAGLAGLRVYAPVPGWINPYVSPLASSIPTVNVQTYYVVEGLAGQPVADMTIGGLSAAQNYVLSVTDNRFVISGNRLSLGGSVVLNHSATPSIAVWVKLQSRTNPNFEFSKLVTFLVYPNAADRGDLPASFEPTSSPAVHQLNGLRFGRRLDGDSTSQSSINADGDDRDAEGNDDDGITMLSTLRRTNQAYSGSFLVNSSGVGFVDAWFDFNGNGRFEHPQEHFAAGTSRRVTAGFTSLPLTIPAGLTAAGLVAARFRLSPNGGLTPGGTVNGGEVEDYYLAVDADTLPPRWCVQFPIIDIAITIDISITAQGMTVRDQQSTLLDLTNSMLAPLNIIAGELDDTLRLHAIVPQREVIFQGGAGTDTLSFDQPSGVIDFATGLLQTDSIELVSLANSSAQSLIFPARLPTTSTSNQQQLRLVADSRDTLVFDKAWQIASPTFDEQGFVHRLNNGPQNLWLQTPNFWSNPLTSEDTNGDGQVTPLDALLVINGLNQNTGLRLPANPGEVNEWVYYDSNRSNSLEPLDALLVINKLNTRN